MILTLVRYWSNFNATLGRLFIDSQPECFVLEDAYRPAKVAGQTRIPSGKYQVGLRFSPKFSPIYGHDMLWVKDVPNYEFILIHKGNTDKDTAGCLLVGQKVQGTTILDSGKAYYPLHEKIAPKANAGELTLVIIDFDRLDLPTKA